MVAAQSTALATILTHSPDQASFVDSRKQEEVVRIWPGVVERVWNSRLRENQELSARLDCILRSRPKYTEELSPKTRGGWNGSLPHRKFG